MYGPRVASAVTAHEIYDEFTIGPTVAQLLLQRALYVRAKYTWKLSWEFCLLDPMDVVTINDPGLGLNQAKVRIVSIEEDNDGFLTVTAEELVSGIGTPASNPSGGTSSQQHNFAQTAISVNNPLIYQPPTTLTGGTAQVWVGASPQAVGASTQWGGCNVWVSLDNATYAQVATITKPINQGLLSAPLPIAIAGTDPSHTLSVDLSMSGGALSNVDATSASLGVTRSLVDNELVSFTVANLTAASAYDLTGLYRGLSSTAPAPHSTGGFFARLDEAIVAYDIPSGIIGQTVYFKFQSFNAFGGGLQMLSTAPSIRSTSAAPAPPIRSPFNCSPARRSTSARSAPRRPSPTTSAESPPRSATSSTSATSASCRTRSRSRWRAASRSTLGRLSA
jgi:Putative phage tail protein